MSSTANDRFRSALERHRLPTLERAAEVETLQLNVGRKCNQTCRHCHVNAGPSRTEIMTATVAEDCIALLDRMPSIRVLDITGGAPELAPPFRHLVREGRRRGLRVLDRCNLTILTEPGHEDLAAFLAREAVEIIASLPCYTAGNVDKQRGDGVFDRSIAGLRLLNELGYGELEGETGDSLRLSLIYNPLGASLPPPQETLERDYRERLKSDFGVRFDRLLTITNMPIGRFRSDLQRQGILDGYLGKLEEAFNPDTIPELMCRTLLSVDHEGRLFDCDFNQMLALGMTGGARTVRDLLDGIPLARQIATATHCLGCSAGCGSSCGGALSPALPSGV